MIGRRVGGGGGGGKRNGIAGQAERDEGSAPTALDTVAYWLTVVGLYVLEGALWYYPFKEKVFDDDLIAPPSIKKQFDGSFIDSFPGTSVSWAILGILQGIIVVVLAASLVRGEFLPQRPKPILLSALALSLVVFALLLFGESMTSQFDSVASLFTYFGVTVVLMVFVLLLAWLPIGRVRVGRRARRSQRTKPTARP
jgi:hypothetical protein